MRFVAMLAFVSCSLTLSLTGAACGGDYRVQPPPDMRITLDLASPPGAPDDMTCFNTACGGCSTWARPDGTPAQVGDPCGFRGMLACTGTTLGCSDLSCPTCAAPAGAKMTGTLCAADGKTIVQLLDVNGQCRVNPTGSALAVCNRDGSDRCLHRCTLSGTLYTCTAACASTPDAGVTGCAHSPSQTCQTLTGC
jgi:hypothetical protein